MLEVNDAYGFWGIDRVHGSFRFRDVRTVTTKAAISTILEELTGFLPRRSSRIPLRNVAAGAYVLHVASVYTCVALRAGSDGCVQVS